MSLKFSVDIGGFVPIYDYGKELVESALVLVGDKWVSAIEVNLKHKIGGVGRLFIELSKPMTRIQRSVVMTNMLKQIKDGHIYLVIKPINNSDMFYNNASFGLAWSHRIDGEQDSLPINIYDPKFTVDDVLTEEIMTS